MKPVSWKRASPPRLVRAFESAVRRLPGTTSRQMFGHPAIFLRGHMVAGLVRDRMILRLSERDRDRFLALEGARPFIAMGRSMRQWVVVPPTMVGTPARLQRWLRRAMTHARSLPAKPARRPAR